MRKINRIKEFSQKHIYALGIFAFIMVYSFMVPGEFKLWDADKAVLAIHAVDFGLGFCSKLLPGAIYNLFFDSVSTVKTSIYLMVLLIGFFSVLSLLLEKFVLHIEPEYRKTAFIILAFFLTGPSTFAIHVYYPGMLDMYWVFCALLFFVFLSKKKLTPLVFLPFVICVTVYFASLICFIPFFIIILLYEISCSETRKEKIQLWIVLIVSAVAAVGLSVYFAVCETDNLVYTMEEFHKIYSERGTDNYFYFDQSLYKHSVSNYTDEYITKMQNVKTPIERISLELFIRIAYNLHKITLKDKLIIFALIFPVTALIFAFIFNQIKYNAKIKHGLKLFSDICTVALPFFTLCASVFFSEDLVRWIGHTFLTLSTIFIYILHKEGKEAWKWVEERISKIPLPVILLYFTFYATTVYHPYYIG